MKIKFGKFFEHYLDNSARADVFCDNIAIGKVVRLRGYDGRVSGYHAHIWRDPDNPVEFSEYLFGPRPAGVHAEKKRRLKVRIEEYLAEFYRDSASELFRVRPLV